MIRIGFDVGGTFTDFTLHDTRTGALHHFKVPSTPSDMSEAIAAGTAALMERYGIAAEDISFVGHGTTVATNMVIEGRGVPTGLITTRGFRDVLEIGRQTRPHLYDYTVRNPPPLVPREHRIEVAERLDAAGAVLQPLDEAAVARSVDTLRTAGMEAVAICFLHSYLNPAHEQRAAEIVRSRMPDVFVCTSAGVLPEFREYERFSTAVINAYVGPRMVHYLHRLLDRLQALGLTREPYTVHSNGGLLPVETVRRFPVRTCLSGPAAGVVGAAQVGKQAGFTDLITFDAGGTSTDVSLVKDAAPAFATARTVAGYPIRTPMIDVHVIGAGGGSLAILDDAGALKVGPASAGADPGPVAYGRGGTTPTLTDANIVLGRLDPDALLGGRMHLDRDAACRTIQQRIASPLGLTLEEAALGIVRIAVANMSRAIRSVSTEKGHDVGVFTLFAYGGAGPLHATALAAECGIPRVLVPIEPGTMCARGILLSDLSLDLVRSEIITADAEGWRRVMASFNHLRQDGASWLDQERVAEPRRRYLSTADARYVGQNHEVQVPADMHELSGFLAAFTEAHRREYGYDAPGRAVEIVSCRVKAVGRIEPPPSRFTGGIGAPRPKISRLVCFDDYAASPHLTPTLSAPRGGEGAAYAHRGRVTWGADTPIYDRATLAADVRLNGPAVIEEMSATTLVPPDWTCRVDASGNLILESRA